MGPCLRLGHQRPRAITSWWQFEVSIGLAQIGNWVITRALPVVGAFGSRAGRLLVGTGGEVVQVADDGLAGEVLDLLVECRGLG